MGSLYRRMVRRKLLSDSFFKKTLKETRKQLDEPVNVWYVLKGLQQYESKVEQAAREKKSEGDS